MGIKGGRMTGLPATERFQLLTTAGEDGCVLWVGATVNSGYGVWGLNGKQTTAHRAAYALFVAEIPDGYQIDHLCRNKLCVNVEHLEAVSPLENMVRSGNPKALKVFATHCWRGHEFTEENTYNRTAGNGRRQCKECNRARDRERYRKYGKRRKRSA